MRQNRSLRSKFRVIVSRAATAVQISIPAPCETEGLSLMRLLIYTYGLPLDCRTNQEQLTFHAQAYIPTQPAQAIQEARISHAHEDPGRPEGSCPPPRQGAQARAEERR